MRTQEAQKHTDPTDPEYWLEQSFDIHVLATSVVDRHCFKAYPDPTFHFNADPDPDPFSSYTQNQYSNSF